MQAVESALTDRPQFIESLASDVYGPTGNAATTRAQVESVRRACKRLAALGRAELTYRTALNAKRGGAWASRYLMAAKAKEQQR